MNKEKDSKYYDDGFTNNPEYNCHYMKSWYFPMWQKIIELIPSKESKILEIGCGTGQFAEMLLDYEYKNYFGFDFSKIAIEKCNRLGGYFLVQDARVSGGCYQSKYNTTICLEVLEHINNDISVLQNIKSGTLFIGSVPQTNDPAHVRVFRKKEDLLKRYSKYININNIIDINFRFIFSGVIE